jgi:hypothetical protein
MPPQPARTGTHALRPPLPPRLAERAIDCDVTPLPVAPAPLMRSTPVDALSVTLWLGSKGGRSQLNAPHDDKRSQATTTPPARRESVRGWPPAKKKTPRSASHPAAAQHLSNTSYAGGPGPQPPHAARGGLCRAGDDAGGRRRRVHHNVLGTSCISTQTTLKSEAFGRGVRWCWFESPLRPMPASPAQACNRMNTYAPERRQAPSRSNTCRRYGQTPAGTPVKYHVLLEAQPIHVPQVQRLAPQARRTPPEAWSNTCH